VTSKSYYALLDLPPTASGEDIKKAFRQQIARYHPDKVQHLGKEFQDMAAHRAAELTEAYRILSNDGSRAEVRSDVGGGACRSGRDGSSAGSASTTSTCATIIEERRGGSRSRRSSGREAFHEERAGRDDYLRKATLSRFQHAVEAVADYDASSLKGFDLALTPKSKMFGRNRNPRLLGRYVRRSTARRLPTR